MKEINAVIAADRRFVRDVAAPQIGEMLKGVFDTRGKSYFEDMPNNSRCLHREHNPPGHMVIPQGKRYIHICPGCGKRAVINASQVTW